MSGIGYLHYTLARVWEHLRRKRVEKENKHEGSNHSIDAVKEDDGIQHFPHALDGAKTKPYGDPDFEEKQRHSSD